jgi:TetR/AcrR family transcriptional regulator
MSTPAYRGVMARRPAVGPTLAGADSSRLRRDRDNIRELLLEAAIAEFAQKGYNGASTTSIANRAEAHQPQINYHFSSKPELWKAAVDCLFTQLDAALADIEFDKDLTAGFAELVRRIVVHAASHPELNQIMVQESTAPSERLTWITETHVRQRYDALRELWTALRELGVAAPIDADVIYYVVVGATSLPFINHAEARMLLTGDLGSDEQIDSHVAGILAMLLPGLQT